MNTRDIIILARKRITDDCPIRDRAQRVIRTSSKSRQQFLRGLQMRARALLAVEQELSRLAEAIADA